MAAVSAPQGAKRADDDDDDDEYDYPENKPGFLAALFGGGAKREAGQDGADEAKKIMLTDKQKIILIIAGVVIAVLISIPLSKVIVNMFKPEMVEVPNVVGMEQEKATDTLTELGFSVDVTPEPLPYVEPAAPLTAGEDSESLDLGGVDNTPAPAQSAAASEPAFKVGQVMSQNPAAGEVVKKGAKVKLVVADEPIKPDKPANEDNEPSTEIKEVPDLIGKTKASAEYAISTAGFKIGNVSYKTGDAPVDTVIEQSPKKGEKAPGNSPINIVICSGPKEVTATVPNLVGKTADEAKAALASLKLNIAVKEDPNSALPIGTVISQSPASGSSLKEGGTVTVTISVGVKVPNLTGLTEAEAKAKLAELGLKYEKLAEVENANAVGRVVTQDTAADTAVFKGTTIKCTIGKAPPPPPQQFTVKFVDSLNGNAEISRQTVNAGGSATPPTPPTHPGYKFSGWSGTYQNVYGDSTVVAQYVADAPTITGVTITGGNSSVTPGGTVQFTATVTGTGSFNPNVTWSISGPGATIDGSGFLTVDPGAAPGTSFTVIATAQGDSSKTASWTVTVQ